MFVGIEGKRHQVRHNMGVWAGHSQALCGGVGGWGVMMGMVVLIMLH